MHSLLKGDEALFSRALHQGELSASPMADAAHAELDAFVATWGFSAGLEAEMAALDSGQRLRLEAYCLGFQEQQHSHRIWPWTRSEFPRSNWTMADSLLLARTWGFFSWWETRGELVFTLLDLVQNGLAWSRLADLFPQLGPEPDRKLWADVERVAPLSPAAVSLLSRLRRWRPGVTVLEPCLGASVITDVTEPGLPFVEMTVKTPQTNLRGLSLPGIPGFVTGRSDSLAWHFCPSFGDIVDFHMVPDGGLVLRWAGRDQTGSLAAFFAVERATNRQDLRKAVSKRGAAALTLSVTDLQGGESWELGLRWNRINARDAWLPSTESAKLGLAEASVVSAVTQWVRQKVSGSPADPSAQVLEVLIDTFPIRAETLLPQVRFLLHEGNDGGLRMWSGRPSEGEQARQFERLCRAVVRAFWQTGGLDPDPDSPVFGRLLPVVDRLVAAPHSSWLPSGEKNAILRTAVRAAFDPKSLDETTVERKLSPRYWGRETLGGKSRVFASVVFVAADLGQETLRVFHTDDETETPVFHEL